MKFFCRLLLLACIVVTVCYLMCMSNAAIKTAAASLTESLRIAAEIAELNLFRGQMAVARVADLLGLPGVSHDPRCDTREGLYEVISDLMMQIELAAL